MKLVTKQQVFSPSVETVLSELRDSFKQPNYADPGVAYTGKYKKLLSGNKFEIRDQTPFVINFGSSAGNPASFFLGKRVCITHISFTQYNVTGIVSIERVGFQNQSLTTYFEFLIANGNILTPITFLFPTPLILEGGLVIDNGWADATTATVECNVVGWTEDP